MSRGVIVITGSSRGIGKEVAKQLLKLGYSVTINGRNAVRLETTRVELLEISPDILATVCDVSDPQGALFLIKETLSKFGRIDGVINNVGISSRGNLADLDPGVIKRVFESNVFAAIYTTQAAIPYLRTTKGSLVFVSSLAGIHGLPGLSPYSASKSALRSFVESIRIEEFNSGIHAGIVLVGKAAIASDKEVLTSEGTSRLLQFREGKGIQSIPDVAKGIIKTMQKRKYLVTMTPLGKMQYFLQLIAPRWVERIIIRNLHRFEKESQ